MNFCRCQGTLEEIMIVRDTEHLNLSDKGDIEIKMDSSRSGVENKVNVCEFLKVGSELDSDMIPTWNEPYVDIESMLKVPSTILFPLELSRHLKEKLTAMVEDNWHLMKHIKFQEVEICDLRHFRDEYKDAIMTLKKESPTLLSTKVIDLSKKNRDMSSQIEGMKTKTQQLLAENETMKRKLITLPLSGPPSVNGSDSMSIDGSVLNSSRTDGSDIASVNQQLNKTTAKMMEYRRQNHLLQIELRTALRALCQEVGEGTTPKTVLKEITGPESTWRGRQQQIIALTQKVSEFQIKLAQQMAVKQESPTSSIMSDDDQPQGLQTFHLHNGCGDMGGGGDMSRSNIPTYISTVSKRQVTALQNYEKKKQNQLEKLNHDLTEFRNELKSSQLEAKGSKARSQFLESQVRSLRVELDEFGIKFGSKQESLKQAQEELKELRQELLTVREREKRHREISCTELHEANQALARERSVVVRLQKLIAEKQEHLQKLDSKVVRLEDDLRIYSSSCPGVDNTEKIKTLENQLQVATQSIHNAERERERLLTLISNSVGEVQKERQTHNEADRLLSRAFEILNLTDACINRCLDAGQVTSKAILEEVEEIRALVRELKAGINHSFDYDYDILNIPIPSIFATTSRSSTRLKNDKLDLRHSISKESQHSDKITTKKNMVTLKQIRYSKT